MQVINIKTFTEALKISNQQDRQLKFEWADGGVHGIIYGDEILLDNGGGIVVGTRELSYGTRYYLRCNKCAHNRQWLFCSDDMTYFVCRECVGYRYGTQRTSIPLEKAHYRLRRQLRKLDPEAVYMGLDSALPIDKPKNKHWDKWADQRAKYIDLYVEANHIWLKGLGNRYK
jgi:hypothetical protein